MADVEGSETLCAIFTEGPTYCHSIGGKQEKVLRRIIIQMMQRRTESEHG